MYVIGIDQGTTSTRAIVFDESGVPVFTDQIELLQSYTKPGWVEHDPNEIFLTVIHCLTKAVKNVGKKKVATIGITNQRETTIAWDIETGEPLHNAIVWQDTRTQDLVKEFQFMDSYRSTTGLPVSTYFSALKIRWLIDHVPHVREALLKGTCRFGTVDAWLVFKLTGKVVTDVTNASRYNLMDLKKLKWNEEVCAGYGIPVESLPSIISSSEFIAEIDLANIDLDSLTDISTNEKLEIRNSDALNGLKVTSIIGDQQAALLGHGCLQPGDTKVTYGTGSFILSNCGDNVPDLNDSLLVTVGYQLGTNARAYYAYEGSVASAGKVMDVLKSIGMIVEVEQVEEFAKQVESSEGVTIVPAFTGLFCPQWRPDARGVITGLSLKTDVRHICRAALEAVAMQVKHVVDEIAKCVNVQWIVTDGGMTNNKLLMQLQADVMNKIIDLPAFKEATAWGAALAAGLAVGFYRLDSIKTYITNQGECENLKPCMADEHRHMLEEQFNDAVPRSFNLSQFTK